MAFSRCFKTNKMTGVKCNLIITGFLAQLPYIIVLNTDSMSWEQRTSSFKRLLDRRSSSHMDSVTSYICNKNIFSGCAVISGTNLWGSTLLVPKFRKNYQGNYLISQFLKSLHLPRTVYFYLLRLLFLGKAVGGRLLMYTRGVFVKWCLNGLVDCGILPSKGSHLRVDYLALPHFWGQGSPLTGNKSFTAANRYCLDNALEGIWTHLDLGRELFKCCW